MSKKSLLILVAVLGVLLIGGVAAALLIGGNGFLSPSLPAGRTEAPSSLSALDDFMCISVTIGADPQTGQNFCWQTLADIPQGVLQYAPAEGEPAADLSAEAFESLPYQTVQAVSEKQSFQLPAEGQYAYKNPTLVETDGYVHRVYLTGLAAGGAYYYRVGDGNGTWSGIASFKTAPADLGSFSFLYVTDTQGFTAQDYAVWGQLIQAATERHPDAAFILHLGDAVEEGKNLYQWCQFFGAAGGLLQNRTVIEVAGNKDKQHTFRHFTNGAEGDRKALASGYFSFDYGKVHFAVLYTGDGEKDLPKAQLSWLSEDLAAAEGQYKIVLLHKAAYSNANHADDSEIVAIRDQLTPLADQYDVRVVLEGHDHYFFRSEPLYDRTRSEYSAGEEEILGEKTAMFRRKDGHGTVYFINGSAGVKQYSGSIGCASEQIYAEAAFLTAGPTYTYCRVDGEKIVFHTYYADGRLADAWGLYWT